MFEQEDEGTRIGLWVVIGVLFFVLVGIVGGVVLRHMHGKPAAAAAAAPAGTASQASDADALVDAPLGGELVATLYFAIGQADLPADAHVPVGQALQALAATPTRRLMLSGFHDASGDPAANAELARQRALAVRDALRAGGALADQVLLRRPESTTGDGTAEHARRVEIRLVD